MSRIYAKLPDSWLPVRLILGAGYNSAHYNHIHVEGIPKQYGTPPLTNPGMPPSTREIYEAVKEYFPNVRIGIYNRRYISGTTTWSQHSWSNALDIYAYGPDAQQPIFDMLTAKTKPEGGVDVKEVYARLQASLIRSGYDLGDFEPYLPADDPDSLPGADGSWGDLSRAAQDKANLALPPNDGDGLVLAEEAHARLDKLHAV